MERPRTSLLPCLTQVRFLVLLREPADRAHSQFLMRMRLGSMHVRETTHFRSWVLAEVRQLVREGELVTPG